MIPDLQFSLLCDDVRQEKNGKFILIGLFDVITAKQFPLAFPRMCVVSRWCGGEGTFQQVTRLLQPDQTTVLAHGQTIPVRLQNVEATATNIEVFINTQFKEPGTCWVEILLEGDLKLRYPLRIVQLEAAQPQAS
ncbi:MAG: hypothetical protein HYV35_08500 [Lentisphaerae bacterium]|nr:hypothetical protein [Lentisphaerota bacterium]